MELLSRDETPREMLKGRKDDRDGRYKCQEHVRAFVGLFPFQHFCFVSNENVSLYCGDGA